MSGAAGGRGRLVRPIAVAVVVVALLTAMVASTKLRTPGQASALNPPAFNAQTYVDKTFPEVAASLEKKAVPISELAPAVDADPAAAGKKYGTDVGGGNYAFPVKATGTITSVDRNFAIVRFRVCRLRTPSGSRWASR